MSFIGIFSSVVESCVVLAVVFPVARCRRRRHLSSKKEARMKSKIRKKMVIRMNGTLNDAVELAECAET